MTTPRHFAMAASCFFAVAAIPVHHEAQARHSDALFWGGVALTTIATCIAGRVAVLNERDRQRQVMRLAMAAHHDTAGADAGADLANEATATVLAAHVPTGDGANQGVTSGSVGTEAI